MAPPNLDLDGLAAICRAHHVQRMELFGSLAAGTATDSSDVDLLVTFSPDAPKSFLASDGVVALHQALKHFLGRPVDLLDREVVDRDRNPRFRASVLERTELLYAA